MTLERDKAKDILFEFNSLKPSMRDERVAAGVPCKVIREITEDDMIFK